MANTLEGPSHGWPPPVTSADLVQRQTRNVSTLLVLLPLRIFLAAGWLRAAAEKIIERQWWNGHVLRSYVVEQHATTLPFVRPLMDLVIAPSAPLVSLVVVVAELGSGVCLATGRGMRTALYAGVALNVSFVLTGRVNPSAFYLIMEIALLFAIADGAIGLAGRRTSRRTLWAAGGWFCLALVFVPYIRTMEPPM